MFPGDSLQSRWGRISGFQSTASCPELEAQLRHNTTILLIAIGMFESCENCRTRGNTSTVWSMDVELPTSSTTDSGSRDNYLSSYRSDTLAYSEEHVIERAY